MNEQERRTEILKAEEAIRQLSVEMGLAADARAQAEETRAALATVLAELSELRASLDHAASQVSGVISTAQDSVSAAATSALSSATDRLNDAVAQVPEAVRTLESTATLVAATPGHVAEAVKLELSATIAKLIDVSTSVKSLSQQLVEIKQTLSMDLDVKLRNTISSAKWAAIMATIAAVAAVAAALLHLLGGA